MNERLECQLRFALEIDRLKHVLRRSHTLDPQRWENSAERIFGLLPPDQAADLRALWDEFEARKSPEARFARAVDRLMPLLHNLHTGGRSWREHGIHAAQVRAVNRVMERGSTVLWDYIRGEIASAPSDGRLAP